MSIFNSHLLLLEDAKGLRLGNTFTLVHRSPLNLSHTRSHSCLHTRGNLESKFGALSTQQDQGNIEPLKREYVRSLVVEIVVLNELLL